MNRRLSRLCHFAGDALIVGYGIAHYLTDRILAAQAAAVRAGQALEAAQQRADQTRRSR